MKIWLLLVLSAALPVGANADYWRMGFHAPMYDTDPISSVPWASLTHVIQVTLVPNADGSVTDISTDTAATITAAHAHGVSAIMCVTDQGNTNFAAAVANHQSLLVTNIMSKFTSYGFDGVDIDWEAAINFTNMASFVSAMRTALGASILTADALINDYPNWGPSASSLDRVTVLTYAMSGTWDTETWFNAALFGPGDNSEWSINLALTRFNVSSGIALSKLNMGLPFFGQAWTGPATGPRQAISTNTVAEQTYTSIIATDSPLSPTIDSEAKVPWIATGTGWLSYDDPQSITLKVQYGITHSIGGFAIWTIDKDYIAAGTPLHPLLQAVQNAIQYSGISGSGFLGGSGFIK